MPRSPTSAALLAGLALALAASGSAPAQPAPGPGAAPTPATQSDRLRQILGLAPSQEGALQAFVAAMTPRPEEQARLRADAQAMQSLPTPQRLDRMLADMDQMRATLVTKIAATKVFYARLTPDQQRIFDHMSPAGASLSQRPAGAPPVRNGNGPPGGSN